MAPSTPRRKGSPQATGTPSSKVGESRLPKEGEGAPGLSQGGLIQGTHPPHQQPRASNKKAVGPSVPQLRQELQALAGTRRATSPPARAAVVTPLGSKSVAARRNELAQQVAKGERALANPKTPARRAAKEAKRVTGRSKLSAFIDLSPSRRASRPASPRPGPGVQPAAEPKPQAPSPPRPDKRVKAAPKPKTKLAPSPVGASASSDGSSSITNKRKRAVASPSPTRAVTSPSKVSSKKLKPASTPRATLKAKVTPAARPQTRAPATPARGRGKRLAPKGPPRAASPAHAAVRIAAPADGPAGEYKSWFSHLFGGFWFTPKRE